MTEIVSKAKIMYEAMAANILKGDPKSDNIKGLTEVAGIIFHLITTIESQKEEIEKLQKDNKFLTIVNDRYTKSAMAKCAPYYNNEGVYCHGDGEPIKGYTDYKAITELAVKGLKMISRYPHYPEDSHSHSFQTVQKEAVITLSEIARLQNDPIS